MAHTTYTTAVNQTCFQDAMPLPVSCTGEMLERDEEIIHTSVGVLDKAVRILEALENGPITLGRLVSITGLARPTVHRLATALEQHRFASRDEQGQFSLGPRFGEMAAVAGQEQLLSAASPILRSLSNRTGKSVQIFRRQGDHRICIAAEDRQTNPNNSIPTGAILPMRAGAAAQILLAWDPPDRIHQVLRKACFTATKLADVRRRGWAESMNEMEQGVCSISAPIRGATGRVLAAISISGPMERMSQAPGKHYAPLVIAAGRYLTATLQRATTASL